MPVVIRMQAQHASPVQRVKDLGWLLHHTAQVVSLAFLRIPYDRDAWMEGTLVAHLTKGRVYIASWASFGLCCEWLHRPSLRELPFTLIDHTRKEV